MPSGEDDASSVTVRFDTRRVQPARLDRATIRSLCSAVLRGEGVPGRCSVGVSLVDDDEIARLNALHRGIDRPTDVLSFPLDPPSRPGWASSPPEHPPFASPPGRRRELGDIVVSYPRAAAQAEEYGHTLEREVGYLIAHGLLHILGHDHEEEAERALMRRREEAALAAVGLTR